MSTNNYNIILNKILSVNKKSGTKWDDFKKIYDEIKISDEPNIKKLKSTLFVKLLGLSNYEPFRNQEPDFNDVAYELIKNIPDVSFDKLIENIFASNEIRDIIDGLILNDEKFVELFDTYPNLKQYFVQSFENLLLLQLNMIIYTHKSVETGDLQEFIKNIANTLHHKLELLNEPFEQNIIPPVPKQLLPTEETEQSPKTASLDIINPQGSQQDAEIPIELNPTKREEKKSEPIQLIPEYPMPTPRPPPESKPVPQTPKPQTPKPQSSLLTGVFASPTKQFGFPTQSKPTSQPMSSPITGTATGTATITTTATTSTPIVSNPLYNKKNLSERYSNNNNIPIDEYINRIKKYIHDKPGNPWDTLSTNLNGLDTTILNLYAGAKPELVMYIKQLINDFVNVNYDLEDIANRLNNTIPHLDSIVINLDKGEIMNQLNNIRDDIHSGILQLQDKGVSHNILTSILEDFDYYYFQLSYMMSQTEIGPLKEILEGLQNKTWTLDEMEKVLEQLDKLYDQTMTREVNIQESPQIMGQPSSTQQSKFETKQLQMNIEKILEQQNIKTDQPKIIEKKPQQKLPEIRFRQVRQKYRLPRFIKWKLRGGERNWKKY